jgi:glycosyltransferase involved in cell wall biosynthesis
MASNPDRQLAPVVLFVYNRPQHTQKTVAALLRNSLADQTDLIIYSDAAKTDTQALDVQAVRQYIKEAVGFRSKTIIERSHNLGLADSIIEGVTKACADYGKAIVLEDDLETSPHFLAYMNDALDRYADIDSVMHISGCSYPISPLENQETYFLQVPLCWGWATWKRAWDHFERDVAIMNEFSDEMVRNFNFDSTYPYWAQLELNRDGKIRTWFVFWYAKIFRMAGLCLFPSRSLVRNDGFDSSGVNCDATDVYDVAVSTDPVSVEAIPLSLNAQAYQRHIEYFKRIQPGKVGRFVGKLRRLSNKILKRFTGASHRT